MTGRERILAVLHGQKADHLPCMPITTMIAADVFGVRLCFRSLQLTLRSRSGRCEFYWIGWQTGHQKVVLGLDPCLRISIGVPQRRQGFPARP